MKIWMDADGCPVVDITIKAAKRYGAECYILCDTSHEFERDGAETITVSKGTDSVDFALVNRLSKGDIAVTQDYGLAAMCLARGATVIRQDGLLYTESNMDALLSARHEAKKIRRSGGRLKGSSKRSEQDDQRYEEALISLLEKEGKD